MMLQPQRVFFISLIFFFHINTIFSQVLNADFTVVNISDSLYKNITSDMTFSTCLTIPKSDTIFTDSKKYNNNKSYYYLFKYLNGVKLEEDKTWIGFKIDLDRRKKMHITFDQNHNNKILDEKSIQILPNQDYTIDILHMKRRLSFTFSVVKGNFETPLIKIEPTHVLYSEKNILDKKIVITNTALGLHIYMDSMKIGNKPLKFVTIDEPFKFRSNVLKFNNLNTDDLNLEFEYQENSNYYGYRENYFVDTITLCKLLGIPSFQKKYIILYYWAVWCHPCVQNIDKTNKLYDYAILNNTDMYYISYNRNEKTVINTKNFVKNHFLPQNQIYQVGNIPKIDGFISDESLFKLLKVNSFPTYVILSNTGEIVYRGGELEEIYSILKDRKNDN